MKFHEVAKNMSKTYHIAACVYYMIRKDWLEALPDEVQEIVIASAREAAAYQNALDIEAQGASLQKMIDEGLQVNEVNDLGEFQATLEAFKESYVQEKGPEWVDLYNKIKAVE